MLSRSFLFIPADKEKMLKKLNDLHADRIILDLEDAVSPERKQDARDLAVKYFSGLQKEVIIRINDMTTKEFNRDLELIGKLAAYPSLKGIMLPKAVHADEIGYLARMLDTIEWHHDRMERIYVIPLVESALGVKNAFKIASSNERIERLAFGGVDFLKDIDGKSSENEWELLYARSELAISSKSAQISKPIDTVYVNLTDQEGLEKSCIHSKSLGFAGKLLLHPNQIESANRIFSPSEKEIAEAKEIMECRKLHPDQGVFHFNGKMVDRPVIERAERLLAEHEKVGQPNK